MNRFGLYGGVAAAVCMLAAGGARAQETTAGIDGAVRGADRRGAAGVTVQVLFAPQATRFTAVTDGSGRFSLRQLPVGGPYDVVATGPGGEARVRVDSLGLGSPLELTLDLAPAAAPVVVTARRARADTFKTGPRSSFTATDIQTLPTFGRDLKDIARLNPFVTIDPALAGAVQIAGNQGRLNTIYVDGVKQSDDFGLNDGGYPTQRSPISIDVVDSLNVEVAPYDVRYGSFQGGVLNIATKSGGNEFHGGGFFEYDGDHFGAGKRIRDQPIAITFKDKTYGLNLGGPIIPDRVFFEFGYEKLESLAPAGYGPAGAGLTNSIRGVTTADVTNVQNILQSRYGYDAGGFGTTQPTSDEKFFGKLEVKLTDRHRFVFEAQTDYGSQYRTPGDSVTGATLALTSDDYVLQQNLSAYTGFLYSNWTDHLSTELSYTHKDVATLTDNIGGDDFARFQVILPTGSSIVVGPDTFRHANILRNTDQLFRARANYSIGGNVITLGYEREQLDVFNLFNPRSNGVYTFGSVAAGVNGLTDLANGAARQLVYANAFDNVKADGAAVWSDVKHTAYLQDEWRPLAGLTLKGGLRVDIYQQGDQPRANPNFQARYGFSNQQNFDGRYTLQPRFGFNWRPEPTFNLSGGVGLFSGGDPNVYLSNNYSNPGNLLGSATCVLTNAVCPTSLVNINGLKVGTQAQAVNAATAAAGAAPTNVLAPDFDLPAVWKSSISASKTFNFSQWDWTGPAGRLAGDAWTVHVDYLYQFTEHGLRYVDLATLNQVAGQAPDGRPVFNPTRARGTTNFDLELTDTDKGYSSVVAVGLSKTWANGWDADVTYTHQDVRDTGNAPEKVAQISYSEISTIDPNSDRLSRSNYEITNQIKFNVGFQRKVFGDNWSRIRLYAQRRSGQPYSYTFNTGTTGSTGSLTVDPVFGLAAPVATNSGSGVWGLELLYVPKAVNGVVTAVSDPRVTYGPNFNLADFNAFLKQTGLLKYNGSIAPRNGFESRAVTTADLQLTQEIPVYFPTSHAKAEVYFDIFNLGNLINSSWGVLDQFTIPYSYPAVIAANCQAAFSGLAGATQCRAGRGNFYQYNGFTRRTPGVISTSQGQPPPSTYALKVGIRFKF